MQGETGLELEHPISDCHGLTPLPSQFESCSNRCQLPNRGDSNQQAQLASFASAPNDTPVHSTLYSQLTHTTQHRPSPAALSP